MCLRVCLCVCVVAFAHVRLRSTRETSRPAATAGGAPARRTRRDQRLDERHVGEQHGLPPLDELKRLRVAHLEPRDWLGGKREPHGPRSVGRRHAQTSSRCLQAPRAASRWGRDRRWSGAPCGRPRRGQESGGVRRAEVPCLGACTAMLCTTQQHARKAPALVSPARGNPLPRRAAARLPELRSRVEAAAPSIFLLCRLP